ncbi:hypothetical protein [Streptomyces sp. WZ-12]|nr:hypothetical protein [Streptomyces sp. WZ-12]
MTAGAPTRPALAGRPRPPHRRPLPPDAADPAADQATPAATPGGIR